MTFPASFDPNSRHSVLWYWCSLACYAASEMDPQHRQAIFDWPGPCDVQRFDTTPVQSPDWVLGQYDDAYVVAIRGTESAAEALEDIRDVINILEDQQWVGRVHRYFGLSAGAIWETLRLQIEGTPQANRIIFTGHSLGAAVAIVLSQIYALATGHQPLAVVCFGSPRTGNGAFVDAITWPVFRIENFLDPITFVPPPSMIQFRGPAAFGLGQLRLYAHVGKAWVFDNAGHEVEIPWVTEVPGVPAQYPIPVEVIATQIGTSHQLGCYIQRTRARQGSAAFTPAGWPNLGPLHAIATTVMQGDGWEWPWADPVFTPPPLRTSPASPAVVTDNWRHPGAPSNAGAASARRRRRRPR